MNGDAIALITETKSIAAEITGGNDITISIKGIYARLSCSGGGNFKILRKTTSAVVDGCIGIEIVGGGISTSIAIEITSAIIARRSWVVVTRVGYGTSRNGISKRKWYVHC
jgi:ribosomal protein S6E (S10)